MSMAVAFMAELRLFSFNYAPKGWALCNGQLMPINQNQALFSLLGTTFGGNGQTTFGLPDLRGRLPMHVGSGHTLGESAGEEVHTVTMSEMPTHIHALNAAEVNADNINPTGNMFGKFNAGYAPPANLVAITPGTVGNAGGSQAHENRCPYLVVNYGICLVGVFPSRN
jgi:microcystin-dependent protein